jgi:type III restriction enzyme
MSASEKIAKSFSKLPEVFGFAIEYTDPNMNLRSYYPDFVAVEEDGTHWLLETKGQETPEVQRKDEAARRWCEDASALTGNKWRYLKVPQKHFEQLQPATLSDLVLTNAWEGEA